MSEEHVLSSVVLVPPINERSERRRWRTLCWCANVLGFDLSEVTPEELRPPPQSWFVWREDCHSVFTAGPESCMPWAHRLRVKLGPFEEREALKVMKEKNAR